MTSAATKSPRLDARDGEAIVKQARALAPLYTPEWDAGEETGAGATLLKIAARLLDGIIRRLNDVPLKHFIAFLDSIGIKLLPALPARAPLTFLLSKGAKAAVAIPAQSQVAAKVPDDPDPVIFETEKAILATPAKLLTIISVVPLEDEIVDHAAPLAGGETTELFSNQERNLQSHILYLGHDDLFNVKGTAHFVLTVEPAINLVHKSLAWEYFGEKEIVTEAGDTQKSIDWHPFAAAFANGRIRLDKTSLGEIKQVKVNDRNSRWIRCRVKTAAGAKLSQTNQFANLQVRDLRISTPTLPSGVPATSWIDPDAAFYNDLPLTFPLQAGKPLTPFGPAPVERPDGSIAGTRPRPGDVFYLASQDAFSKRGAQIAINVGAVSLGAAGTDVERVQGIGPIRAALLRAKSINTVYQFQSLLPERVAEIIGETNPNFPVSKDLLEAATKGYYDRVVTSDPDQPAAGAAGALRHTPVLSWEYWNGNGWVSIEGLVDNTDALTTVGSVIFPCPADMTMTKVVGQENFWIRARIAFGDYGQEKVTFKVTNEAAAENTVKIDPSGIRPPEIASLKVGYDFVGEGESPQVCLTLNNLDYARVFLPFPDTRTTFAPFSALDDDKQSLYLGFDLPPLKGPISIFFSLREQEYTEANRPRITWEYFRLQPGQTAGEWARLLVADGTQNLTQSGTVEFIGLPDFAPVSRFGKELFWIRAVDDEVRFAAKPKPPDKGMLDPASEQTNALMADGARERPGGSETGGVAARPQLKPCEQVLESLASIVLFPAPAVSTPLAPIVQGIYLNTAWGIQAETIRDELLGSSDGSADQPFALTKPPVISESIWIDELATLTETERKPFNEQKEVDVREKKDAEGNVSEFLIRWRPIDDIAQANPGDRVYEIDRTFGLIKFGDGAKHGRVPPIGKDNIRATYRSGGGSRGNVAARLIKSLRSTIPLVEGALNPEAAGGGSDTELIERALERGPQKIKNRGRAITIEDFEWLAKEASQAIVRAKCLPTFDDVGDYHTGWVTVIIVPGGNDARPLPSPQLRQRVEKYLLDRSANVTAALPAQIRVIPPVYVAVKVEADIFPLSLDLAPQVESDVIATLEKFLHPLSGGYEHTGWDFGRFPCLSDFYALLEAVAGVDHVDNLSLTLQAKTARGESTGDPVLVSEDRPLDVAAPPFTLVYSGEHKITVKSPTTIPIPG